MLIVDVTHALKKSSDVNTSPLPLRVVFKSANHGVNDKGNRGLLALIVE